MPIYEYKCGGCNIVLEILVLGEKEPPECPICGNPMTRKPSIFATKQDRKKERERNILKLASDYLKDGKVEDAKRFLAKAREYVKTDNISRAYDSLIQKTENKPTN